jgi:hypothetical protein
MKARERISRRHTPGRPARSVQPCGWRGCLDPAEDSCEHGRWCAEHGAMHQLARHLGAATGRSRDVAGSAATPAPTRDRPPEADPEPPAEDLEASEYARLRPIPDANSREQCRRCSQPVVRRSDFGWYCADCLDNAAEAADSWGEAGPEWLARFERALGPLDWNPLGPAGPSQPRTGRVQTPFERDRARSH